MSRQDHAFASPARTDDPLAAAILRKVCWRLIPFIFLLYVCNILNRVSVGFARLQMLDDLHLSETVFGLGSGIFFLGYFLFQLPSNLVLNRIGARRWIAGIVIAWGAISSAMMFIHDAWSFYVLRFLLGVAEAGFFPGMILYLTYWIPARERAKATCGFITASAIAGLINGPLSGALVQYLDEAAGLAGWQWMFLLEGIPTMLLGIAAAFWLTDRPATASWLEPEQRAWLTSRMRLEETQRMQLHGVTLAQTFSNPRVWLLCVLYFAFAMGLNGIGLYLPELVRGKFPSADKLEIGLLTAIPYLCAVPSMMLWSAHSDRTGERRWHVALPAFLAAAGWAISGLIEIPWLTLAGLTIAVFAMYCTLAPFWSLPNSFLGGAAAAGGIALINSVGNLGGFAAPYMLSSIKDATQSFTGGLLVMAAILFASGLLALCVRHEKSWEDAEASERGERATN